MTHEVILLKFLEKSDKPDDTTNTKYLLITARYTARLLQTPSN